MSGSKNGTVSLWKDKKIEKSARIFDEWTLVLFKLDSIFAASKNKDIVELNLNLDIVKKFKGRDARPYTIDASENYVAVGYDYNAGKVDVHSRKDLDENGTHQKIMVSNFLY